MHYCVSSASPGNAQVHEALLFLKVNACSLGLAYRTAANAAFGTSSELEAVTGDLSEARMCRHSSLALPKLLLRTCQT